ncbi:MAG: GNAT family protein [Nitrososphaerota archaeon]|nr:GNAT family N-acetyltransferase [Candidatus Bathyarchaeota archaeon]MDW8049321.1 GNAT family protein [Nitrososphaerota archaeon]
MKFEIFNAKEVRLTNEDIRDIVEIECHPKVREWLFEYVGSIDKEFQAYKRFFRRLKKNKRAEILVAKSKDRVVGFLGLWRLGRFMEHVATIGVSVHPDYWGNGIATKLVESAIALAEKEGIVRLEIETLADNKAMRHVAEKLGFKLESIRKLRVQKEGKYHDEASYYMLLNSLNS